MTSQMNIGKIAFSPKRQKSAVKTKFIRLHDVLSFLQYRIKAARRKNPLVLA